MYFWAFIVSILIFGLGGGVSIFQGIIHIRHPQQLGVTAGLETHEITDAIERLRVTIKEEFKLVEFVIIQPQAYPLNKK